MATRAKKSGSTATALDVIAALGKVDAVRRKMFGDVVVAQTKWALLSALYAARLQGVELEMLSTTGASGAPYASARRSLDELIAAQGGAGGFGTGHWKSSTNRAPRDPPPGGHGEGWADRPG
jgi:GTPase involved in cell partitioning and DNA repair